MNYVAAIHVLKGLLQLSEDDYRALLAELTGKRSCTAMSPAELALVYTHFEKQARRSGVQTDQKAPAKGGSPRRKPTAGRELETAVHRKLRALWWALADAGAVTRPLSPAECGHAVEAWAKRQINGTPLGPLDAMRFANNAQLQKLVEELKAWGRRVKADIR